MQMKATVNLPLGKAALSRLPFFPALLFTLLPFPASADDLGDAMAFSVKADYVHAATAFQRAAENGNAEAQFNLGLLYQEGRGLGQDFNQAAVWFNKAAEQGHTLAQVYLASLLFNGKGVAQDKVEAYKWLTIAKGKRHSKSLDEVASQMTQPQLTEARLRADKWLSMQK